MSGARWVQESLLDRNRTTDARVFVVWFKMYPGDEKSRWPRQLLNDDRIVHRWDEPKNAGKWFLQRLSDLKPQRGAGRFPQNPEALWDSYLLFDRQGVWTDLPSGLVSWGYTVMATRNRLEEDYWHAVSRQ